MSKTYTLAELEHITRGFESAHFYATEFMLQDESVVDEVSVFAALDDYAPAEQDSMDGPGCAAGFESAQIFVDWTPADQPEQYVELGNDHARYDEYLSTASALALD